MRWKTAVLVGVALFVPPAAAHSGNAGDESLARAVAAEVTGQTIHDTIARLTLDPAKAYRMVGTATHDNARDWILDEFAGMGLEPRVFEHACAVSGVVVGPLVAARAPEPVPVPAASVLALVEGKRRDEWIVIGGHYDTQEATTGALDNAAGTSMVLELARVFADHQADLDVSVLFAAWDCEEWGVYGSREFVARLPEIETMFGIAPGTLRLKMAVSLDMPGLNWPAQNVAPTYHKGAYSVMHVRTSPIDTFGYKSSYGEYNESNYTAAELQSFRAFRTTVKHAAYEMLGYPKRWVWVEDDAHGRSDHVPFIASGVPGFRLHGPSDEEYPPYHNPLDTLPVAEEIAGGKELLIAGLESAARLVATSAVLVATETDGEALSETDVTVGPGNLRSIPGSAWELAVLAVGVAVLASARRI